MSEDQTLSIDQFMANNDPLPPANWDLVQRNIDDLQGQILDATNKMSFWASQLRGLEEKLHQNRCLVSVLRKVPSDILGPILLFYAFADTNSSPMSSHARWEVVQLMLLCRAWRAAALATHRLWAIVTVDGEDAAEMSYERAAAWLARAGNIPRGIHITMEHQLDCPKQCLSQSAPSPSCRLNASTSLARLVSGEPRLGKSTLFVQHGRCLEWFTNTLSGMADGRGHSVPVESLRLIFMHAGHPPDFTFLSNFASVTTVELVGSQCFGLFQTVAGFLERLTALTVPLGNIGGEAPEVTFATLAKCVRLVKLNMLIVAVPPSGSQTIVNLQAVSCLQIRGVPSISRASPLDVLDYLDFPTLDTLEIDASVKLSPRLAHASYKGIDTSNHMWGLRPVAMGRS